VEGGGLDFDTVRDVHVTIHPARESGAAAVVERIQPGRATALFVGRELEVEQLLAMIAPNDASANDPAPTVVVSALSGMGGIGKTALALHTAHLAVNRSWFSGGVLVVNLRGNDPDNAPVRPDQVYASMLRTLGLPGDQVPRTVHEQASVFHLFLEQLAEADKRVLMVLDNAADVNQVRDLLPRQQAHRALVTTRDVLYLSAAHRISLDVFTACEAASLLTQRLSTANPDDPRPADELDAVNDLVHLCGRLPLAVEIAAAILTDEPNVTVTTLATQLADTKTQLAGLKYGTLDVAAVIDFSYRRLASRSPDAAELLPLLTLNPGPDLATDVAAALAGLTASTIAVRLRELRSASLLQYTASGRWQLHDLVALYASQRLPDDTTSATARLLTCYTDAACAAEEHLTALPGQPVPERFKGRDDALDWFDSERSNLTMAVEHAHRAGYHQHSCDLAASLGEYLHLRRYVDELVSINECAVDAAATLGQPGTIARSWNNLGVALQEVRRCEEAINVHRHAIGIYQGIGDRQGEGMAWNNIGHALTRLGRFGEAVAAHEHARDIHREIGDRRGEGTAWSNLGIALEEVRQFDEAIAAHEHARDIHREIGDRRGEGMVLGNLGVTLTKLRRFEDAITAYQHARSLLRETGDRYREGIASGNLARTLAKVRKIDEAETAAEEALAAFNELGDQQLATWAREMIHSASTIYQG
jgi:tetratricopeptide (TPR) repeat protein